MRDSNPHWIGYEKVHCAKMSFFLCNNYKSYIISLVVLYIIYRIFWSLLLSKMLLRR